MVPTSSTMKSLKAMFRSSSLSQASKLPISLVGRRIWNVRENRGTALRLRSLTEPRDLQRRNQQDFISHRARSPRSRLPTDPGG